MRHRVSLFVLVCATLLSSHPALAQTTILIPSNSVWPFVKGTNAASNPGTAWRQISFDDSTWPISAWSNSATPFNYSWPSVPDTYTNLITGPGTYLDDMQGNYQCILLRRAFVLTNLSSVRNFIYKHQSDDGFVAWINGVEVLRHNMASSGVDPSYRPANVGNAAEGGNGGAVYIGATSSAGLGALVTGTNILAVQACNSSISGSSDFGFNLQLESTMVNVPVPVIMTQPRSQTAQAGSNITFTITAYDMAPLSYQWRFNGQNLAGQTALSLSRTNVQFATAGGYSVVVANSFGSVTSAVAQLTVLLGAAAETPAPLQTEPVIPPKPVLADHLVLVTHGWQPLANLRGAYAQWIEDVADSIRDELPEAESDRWQFVTHHWEDYADVPLPAYALAIANQRGNRFGQRIAEAGYNYVHLIGHSAGSALIQAACQTLRELRPTTTIHLTFLDPYVGLLHQNKSWYGLAADWSDCYLAMDALPGENTPLTHAYNVDVTAVDPDAGDCRLYRCNCGLTSGARCSSSHSWPYRFYLGSVDGSLAGTEGTGFPFSKEGGADLNDMKTQYPIGNVNPPRVLSETTPVFVNSVPSVDYGKLTVSGENGLPAIFGNSGTVLLNGNGFQLQSSLSPAPFHIAKGLNAQSDALFAEPVWLTLGIEVTNRVNFLSFEGFFGSTGAVGQLSIYWNTNLIGVADERMVRPGLQDYTFGLPQTYTNGTHSLGFRLDTYTNVASSLSITNISLGFVGLTEPISLRIGSFSTNGVGLTISAPTNFNYILQGSTNLIDWESFGVVANTNGTVEVFDSGATNYSRQFYRVVVP